MSDGNDRRINGDPAKPVKQLESRLTALWPIIIQVSWYKDGVFKITNSADESVSLLELTPEQLQAIPWEINGREVLAVDKADSILENAGSNIALHVNSKTMWLQHIAITQNP